MTDRVREKLVEIYNKLEDEGLAVIAGKKDMADLMIAHGVTVQDNTEISDELLEQLRNASVMVMTEESPLKWCRSGSRSRIGCPNLRSV